MCRVALRRTLSRACRAFDPREDRDGSVGAAVRRASSRTTSAPREELRASRNRAAVAAAQQLFGQARRHSGALQSPRRRYGNLFECGESGAALHSRVLCAPLRRRCRRTWPLGVDGCGIPVYATSLRNAALSFARLRHARGRRASRDAASAAQRCATRWSPIRSMSPARARSIPSSCSVAEGALRRQGGAEGVHGIAAIATRVWVTFPRCSTAAPAARGPSTDRRAPGAWSVLSEAQAAQTRTFRAPDGV